MSESTPPYVTSPYVTSVAPNLSDERTDERTDHYIERVREKLLQRSQVGLRKYGVTLERSDLDFLKWLHHLQEELLDAAVYIERVFSFERDIEALIELELKFMDDGK